MLTLCFLSFCGCKKGGASSSEWASSEINYIQTELNNIAEDETVDPENTENNRENGTAVYAVTSYLTTDAPEINYEETSSDNTSVTEHGMTFAAVKLNVTAKEEVNLRDRPSTSDSNVVYTLKNGEYITKTGVCNESGWARLEYNGQTVYAIDSFLMQ